MNLQLFQVVFNHAQNNNIPWSRHHLYGNAASEASGKAKLTVVPAEA